MSKRVKINGNISTNWPKWIGCFVLLLYIAIPRAGETKSTTPHSDDFSNAEFAYKEFVKIWIMTADWKEQSKLVKRLIQQARQVQAKYVAISATKAPILVACSFMRQGDVDKHLLQVIQIIPLPHIPNFHWTEERKIIYLEKISSVYIEPGQKRKKQAYLKAAEFARRKKLSLQEVRKMCP